MASGEIKKVFNKESCYIRSVKTEVVDDGEGEESQDWYQQTKVKVEFKSLFWQYGSILTP